MSTNTELKNNDTIQEQKFKAVGHNMMVYKNNLLGYFNKNNIYFINQSIIDNLLETDKVAVGIKDNKVKLQSYFYGVGYINFDLIIEEKDGNGFATLYIVEPIKRVNGLVSQNLRTKIATYENELKNEFYEKLAYSFNIVDESEQMENPDIEKSQTNYIYNRKKINEKMIIDEEIAFNKVYKDLFEVQYKYLTSHKTNFCNAVKKLFDERQAKYEKQFLKVGKKIDYFSMYELLVLCMDEVVNKHPEYDKEEDEFYKNTLPAIQFALQQLRKIKQRFKENQIRLIEKMNQNGVNKEIQAFLDVLQNGDKIKGDQNFKNDKFYTFGLMSKQDGYEINGLRHYRRHWRTRGHNFEELKFDDVREFVSNFSSNFVKVVKNAVVNLDDIIKFSNFDNEVSNSIKDTYSKIMGGIAERSELIRSLLSPDDTTGQINFKDNISSMDYEKSILELDIESDSNEHDDLEIESNDHEHQITIDDDITPFSD